MSKQTAVSQLISTLEDRLETINRETTELREQMIQTFLVDVERYLEMEKQQIIDAYEDGYSDSDNKLSFNKQYYNETYGGNK
jgi:hypothetical protein